MSSPLLTDQDAVERIVIAVSGSSGWPWLADRPYEFRVDGSDIEYRARLCGIIDNYYKFQIRNSDSANLLATGSCVRPKTLCRWMPPSWFNLKIASQQSSSFVRIRMRRGGCTLSIDGCRLPFHPGENRSLCIAPFHTERLDPFPFSRLRYQWSGWIIPDEVLVGISYFVKLLESTLD